MFKIILDNLTNLIDPIDPDVDNKRDKFLFNFFFLFILFFIKL